MSLHIQHHFKAGWRNILKYKTQNIISVLCLSVGTVFFAAVIWFLISLWYTTSPEDKYDNVFSLILFHGDPSLADKSISDFWNANPTVDECNGQNIMLLRQFSTVKDLYYNNNQGGRVFIAKDLQGIEYDIVGNVTIISPNWLEYHNFTSAITGKKLKNLKNGTLLITDRFCRQSLPKVVNPIGFEVSDFYPSTRIADVISTRSYLTHTKDFYLVSDGSEEIMINWEDENHPQRFQPVNISVSSISVILKDGATLEQFKKEAKNKLPQYNLHITPARTDYTLYLVAILVAILGASVLIIGLAGYLKMQVQLFTLRNREMALRRCNGAKTFDLFMLLAAELLIVFVFTMLVAMGVTVAVAEYTIPILSKLTDLFTMDYSLFFEYEAWIVTGAFVIALIIDWFSVRKVIRTPLGKIAGRSFKPKTLWDSTMQVVQLFMATILFFVITSIFISITKYSNNYNLSRDVNFYKHVMTLKSFGRINCDNLKNAETVAHTTIFSYPISFCPSDVTRRDVDDFFYTYVADPKLFKLMNLEVTTDESKYKQSSTEFNMEERRAAYYPIYALRSEARLVRQSLGIKKTLDNEKSILLNGKDFIRIGYAPEPDNYKGDNGYEFHLFELHADLGFGKMQELYNQRIQQKISVGLGISRLETLIQAKEGHYADLVEEIRDRLLDTYSSGGENISIQSAYDQWFSTLILLNLIRQLASLLAIVALISIILSVYSSISLETRGRQKEVAIRKVLGAKTKDIVMLFSRYYFKILIVTFIITAVIGLAIVVIGSIDLRSFSSTLSTAEEMLDLFLIPYLFSIFTISLVTLLTIGQKIYKVAHTNAAEMVKRE